MVPVHVPLLYNTEFSIIFCYLQGPSDREENFRPHSSYSVCVGQITTQQVSLGLH